jgi:Zn-dependent M28 family amino/carboxypeptidase
MTPVPGGLPRERPPTLEITPACAQALLGFDVLAVAAELDRSGKARRPLRTGRRARISASTREAPVRIDNVVGWVRGSDPELAGEVVVVGAHYDHVGVDDRGRVGHGADDTASGTAALIVAAEAFARAPARRSLLFCAFAAEEDGLVGSAELCRRPPVDPRQLVAMLNMDMIGRGEADAVAVIGVPRNPDLGKVLERARKLAGTGVRDLETRRGEELWTRSDHYSFHRIGVPSLFFFEGLPISRNPDYHTWRDTPDQLDFDKIARTARLVFNTAWLLANDAARPDAPRD